MQDLNMKKIELNENKCSQIHAVKQNKECSEQLFFFKVTDTKYVGDWITFNGKKEELSRFIRGMLVITTTMRILNEISVGENYFIVSKMMRDAFLLSYIIFNVLKHTRRNRKV